MTDVHRARRRRGSPLRIAPRGAARARAGPGASSSATSSSTGARWIFFVSGFFEPFFYLLSIGVGLNKLVGPIHVGQRAHPLHHLRRPRAAGVLGHERRHPRLDLQRLLQAEDRQDLRRRAVHAARPRRRRPGRADVVRSCGPRSTRPPSSWSWPASATCSRRGPSCACRPPCHQLRLRRASGWRAPPTCAAGRTSTRSRWPSSRCSCSPPPSIPLSVYPGWLQAVIRCTPLYQGVALLRGLDTGHRVVVTGRPRRLSGRGRMPRPRGGHPPHGRPAPALIPAILTRPPGAARAGCRGPAGRCLAGYIRYYPCTSTDIRRSMMPGPSPPPRPSRRPRPASTAARARLISLDDAGRLAGLLGLIADPVRSRLLFALSVGGTAVRRRPRPGPRGHRRRRLLRAAHAAHRGARDLPQGGPGRLLLAWPRRSPIRCSSTACASC